VSLLTNEILHAIARVAVRVGPPVRAKKIVDAVGRLLPPLSLGEAMRAAQELARSGTCLTQALTIAARLPDAEVVLGSEGPGERGFTAHAWVDRNGTVIGAGGASRIELTRLGGAR